MRISDLKISISGIRGIVGESLTPHLLIRFSEAFSTYIGGGDIAVSSDTRPSREMIKFAVFSGILSCGACPIDLGILPIPSLQIYVHEKNIAGGISITASHNPIEWNALKLIKKGGRFLNDYEAEELLDLYYQGKFRRIQKPEQVKQEKNPFSFHEQKVLQLSDTELIKKTRPKVIIDACAGAAAPFVKEFLEKRGAEVKCINCEITGEFPRNPEPVAENLSALCKAVKKYGADIGFAQDADADRLAVVDEKGIPIGSEYTLALAVQYNLTEKKKTPVVVNLSTSRVISDICAKEGVELFRTKVGEINVSRKMKQLGAGIGGEGNGGIIVSNVHTCRDSFSGMALILEYLCRSGKTVSELRTSMPDYYMVTGKIRASYRERKRILTHLNARFKKGKTDRTDGLRVDYPEFWFHIRPSNTEPIIRIIVESRDKEKAKDIYERIREEI
jgi:phosphomannomutase